MHGGPLLGGLILLAELATATDYGTFDNPANNARMKFRYWLPDASVDISTVQSDIEAAGAVGAGAVELLPLYNYGGSLAGPPVGADWAKYGFGTPAFNEVFKASLQAAKDAGMRMDFALGPNQGQGVPAKTTDPGLHWDLVSHHLVIFTHHLLTVILGTLQCQHPNKWLLSGSNSWLGNWRTGCVGLC
jgi:hypothetical protein